MQKISLPSQATQVAFYGHRHPTTSTQIQKKEENFLFLGLINGYLMGFRGKDCIWQYKKIKNPIRILKFVKTNELWCISSDGILRIFLLSYNLDKNDVDSMKSLRVELSRKIRGLHSSSDHHHHHLPITSICSLDEEGIATGDDSGCIRIWKWDSFELQREYRFNGDFIGDMRYVEAKKMLFAVSGDGSLVVFNVRHDELVAQSDNFDDEYSSLEFVLHGKKLVCFSPSCFTDVYLWDFWGKLADRIATESDDSLEEGFSVDCSCKYDEETLIVGCSDGRIRILRFPKGEFSNGIVENEHELPVEGLVLSSDRSFLASIGHDECVRIWEIGEIIFEEETTLAVNEEESVKKKRKKQSNHKKRSQQTDDFFADLMMK